MTAFDVKALHDLCSNNKALLEKSGVAGCFYCCDTFHPSEVKEWIDGGDTALCPKCGIDSVLPSASVALSPALLLAMNEHWFAYSKFVRG